LPFRTIIETKVPYSFELLDLEQDFVKCYKILRKEKKLNYTFEFFSDEKKINFNVTFWYGSGCGSGRPKNIPYGSCGSGSVSRYRSGTQVKAIKKLQ
jgi:hypothetical protein